MDFAAAESLATDTGMVTIKAHIIPGPPKSYEDFPEGRSMFTSMADTPITVDKRFLGLSQRMA